MDRVWILLGNILWLAREEEMQTEPLTHTHPMPYRLCRLQTLFMQL